jgi:hypothetical protein
MKWKPMSELPAEYGITNRMLLVKGFNIDIGNGKLYDTDPYAVWITLGGKMPRWPHKFEPTHFYEFPKGLNDES